MIEQQLLNLDKQTLDEEWMITIDKIIIVTKMNEENDTIYLRNGKYATSERSGEWDMHA